MPRSGYESMFRSESVPCRHDCKLCTVLAPCSRTVCDMAFLSSVERETPHLSQPPRANCNQTLDPSQVEKPVEKPHDVLITSCLHKHSSTPP